MPRVIVGNLNTDLVLTNDFGVWIGTPLMNVETVNSEFTGDVVRGMHTDLQLSSEFTYSISGNRTITTTLLETSIFSGSLIRLDYPNTDIPILEVPPQPVPNPDLPHSFTDAGNLAPTYFSIYYNGTLLLTLSAPELTDSETLRNIQVKDYTRGNTLVMYRNVSWGNQKIFEYTFEYMTKGQRTALGNVLRVWLGKRITIVDHLGLTRLGFIVTPEADIFESVPRGFSATFKFQQVD